MKTTVINWLIELASNAQTHNIRVREVTIAEKDYVKLMTELLWSSRIKPEPVDTQDYVDIVTHNGPLRVKRADA